MKPPAARLKRTPPEQTGPVRNSIAPQPRTASPVSAPETAAPVSSTAKPGAARDPITAAGAAVCGALENGVLTAYSVIDEYMRRGQDTARGIFNDPNMRGNMSDDRGNFPGGFNPANPLAMLTEQWMMAMRPWTQAWSAFVPGMMQQPGMNPFATNANPAPTVSVKISSTSPVEVTANLYPGLDMAGLVCDPLRAEASAATAAATPIDPAEIVRDPGGVRVSVKVASKQPAGRYRGYIRKKADGSVAGDLMVVVS
jgi:hypothetical protein